jgi:hypothetical protein
MLEQIALAMLVALATDQLTGILTSVDILEGARAWFRRTFPSVGKLSWCGYCQSFWLSGLAGMVLPMDAVAILFPFAWMGFLFKWIFLWMVIFGARNYMNQAFSLMVASEEFVKMYVTPSDQDPGSSQK